VSKKPDKKPRIVETPPGRKEAKHVADTSVLDRKAAWRINQIQMVDPYGWHELTVDKLSYIKSKLSELEKKTWAEIFVKEKHWNHPLPVAELKCPLARRWMRNNMQDQDQLWTIRLSGAERIWGVFSDGAYLVLFWDPDHIIWETPKR